MATLTLTKSRHRVSVWTMERRMFDAWFARTTTGKHVKRPARIVNGVKRPAFRTEGN